MRYNLKPWIACILTLLAVAPFVFFSFHAQSPIDYFARRYDRLEVLAACAFTFPFFLLLSFSPRFARHCARDPHRADETMTTGRYVLLIIPLIVVVCLVL